MLEDVAQRGTRLREALEGVRDTALSHASVDGTGLMQRFSLRDAHGDRGGEPAVQHQQWLFMGTAPLVITDEECQELGERMTDEIRTYLRGEAATSLDV
ncbi:hypothetical protein [Streptomyces sp. NPDC087300]|uniref:hypothetical protein n=1 Tax=Streptomyces sp. NPDC087300 TaxID=3365780 RepID=UPI003808BAE8